jgi:hypothetical protein
VSGAQPYFSQILFKYRWLYGFKIWKWSKKRSTPQSFKGKLMSTLICNMWPNQGAMVTRRTTPYPLKGVQVTLE